MKCRARSPTPEGDAVQIGQNAPGRVRKTVHGKSAPRLSIQKTTTADSKKTVIFYDALFYWAFLFCLPALFCRAEEASPPKTLEYYPRPGEPKTGALDFSWLNEKPAGLHGPVLTDGGRFVFEDGTPVKFFGVNLGFGAATPDKETAEAFVREMASSGVNFVRIHAIDCTYSGIVDYSGLKEGKPTNLFDHDKLDRLDYLISLCKKNGIYLHLDTNAGRVLSTGDGFPPEEAEAGGTGTLRGIRFFIDRIAEMETRFALALLDHRNPYTGTRYAEEPAVAVVQYANESSVLWLNNGGIENAFTRELKLRFNEWLRGKYGTRDKLAEAWTDGAGNGALRDGEDPANDSVAAPTLGVWAEATIEPNTPFSELNSPPRHADFITFLSEIEKGVFERFYRKARELGYRSAINLSNYPSGPADTRLIALGDVMEKNAYWNHPVGDYSVPSRFPLGEMASIDPRAVFNKNEGGIESRRNDHTLHSLGVAARASVVDKPLIITEWNVTNPTPFRADALLQMAAYGAFQDWDGICVFIYSFNGDAATFLNTKSFTSFFNVNVDPAIYGPFGIAAAVFRLGLVEKGRNRVELAVTPNDILAQDHDYARIPMVTSFVSRFAIRFIDEVYDGDADLVLPSQNVSDGDFTQAKRLLIERRNDLSDPFHKTKLAESWRAAQVEPNSSSESLNGVSFRVGSKTALYDAPFGDSLDAVLTTAMRRFGLLTDQEGWSPERVVSDTEQLLYDVEHGFFRADTPRFAAMAGKNITLCTTDRCSLKTANDRTALALLSLDDLPMEKSERILLFALGRCYNSGQKWEGDTLTDLGTAPILCEEIQGELSLRSEHSSARGWRLDPWGKRIGEIPIRKTDGGFCAELGDAFFYELTFDDAK